MKRPDDKEPALVLPTTPADATETPATLDVAELLRWLGTQRLALRGAHDERDLAYRLGWAGAIDHLRREIALRSKRS